MPPPQRPKGQGNKGETGPGGADGRGGSRAGKRAEKTTLKNNNKKKHLKSAHGESLCAEESLAWLGFARRVVAQRGPGAGPEEEEEEAVGRVAAC